MFSTILSKNITSPLYKLIELQKKVAMGDFNQRTNFKRKDEIGKIAENFDDMTAMLARLFENLKERELRLQTIYDNILVRIGITTLDRIVIDLNQKCCEITGYSKEESTRI